MVGTIRRSDGGTIRSNIRLSVCLFICMHLVSSLACAEILIPMAERVIATRADNPRAAMPEEIREAASRTSTAVEEAGDVAAAIALAQTTAQPDSVVVITGSIYIVGEAMRLLGARI